MAPRPEFTSESLQASLAAIFDQAQNSVVNHRKNCVALYKIHVNASMVEKQSKKRPARADQAEFIAAFLDMISRAVIVKKGPPTVDRIIKFVAQYVRFVNEKAQEEKAKHQPEIPTNSISSGSVDDEDTLASVFASSILEWIIQGFLAKNKIVRYHTVHMVAEMILFLGEIDEDSYLALRENLIERSTCDKESTIRAQAVSALARLVGSEDPSELQHGEKSILEVILDVLSMDPAADVRRAALLHVPLTADTLPALLTRTRDVDPLTRKLVYAGVLTPRLGHPRHLSIAQREQLVQTGLGDREPAVRLAAGKMVAAWFDLVLADPHSEDANPDADAVPWAGDDGGVMRGLVAFLTLFDVVGPGEAVAVDAVLSLLATRSDLFDIFVFDDDYWKHLTPESAVLARIFLEQCLTAEREDRLESASLPVVTAFAFHIQEAYNQLLGVLDDAEVAKALSGEDEAGDEIEEELAKRELILGELLRMAVKLDYMDEIGRRKVYTVTRDMLAHPQLPPGLIERCLDVLKEIMPTERELIRVVVEIVMDLREPEEEDLEVNETQDHDTTQSDITQSTIRKERSLRRAKDRSGMSVEEGVKADLTDMRCLALCISMLERVHGNFEDNSTLEGILADLIIPAVRRKEIGIREKGLVGLGLCCLIAKSIAVKSLQLFLSQIQNAPEELKFKILQIVFDLMIMYDGQLWGRPEDGQAILTFLADTLEAEESSMVQAVLCVGLAKLLLSGLTEDPRILKSLLLAYVSPYTAGNSELRQCLSYFFSVYCYASAENQSRLRSIFMPAFDEVVRMHDDLGEDQTMVTPQQFGLLIIDWTDSRKAAETATPSYPCQIHADLAVDILLALYDSDRRGEDQEVLCTLLSHLHIEAPLGAELLVKLSILLEHIQTQCPFDDPTLDKAVVRFKTRFTAAFEMDVSDVDWAGNLTQEIRDLYDFIGIEVPVYPDEQEVGEGTPESSVPPKNRTDESPKRSRSKPTRTSSEGSGSDNEAPPNPASPPEESRQSEESEPGTAEEDEAPAPTPVPEPKLSAKRPPAKASQSRPSRPPSEKSGQSSEDELEAPPPASPSPVPIRKATRGRAPAKSSRSRSKPAPPPPPEENEQSSEDAAASPPPSPGPPPKARKTRAPARTSRSKAPPSRENDNASADEDVPIPSPPPARRSRSRAAPPPAEDTDQASGSDAENTAPPAGPVTPVKKGRKRVRTPSAKVALPSPAEKKRSRVARTSSRNPAPIPARGTRSSSRRKAPQIQAMGDLPPEESDDELGPL
ncbi:nuclear condensing complex subunit [Mycena crocata]|nr:nuclear condensing complex subunit [Mycena crocata]